MNPTDCSLPVPLSSGRGVGVRGALEAEPHGNHEQCQMGFQAEGLLHTGANERSRRPPWEKPPKTLSSAESATHPSLKLSWWGVRIYALDVRLHPLSRFASLSSVNATKLTFPAASPLLERIPNHAATPRAAPISSTPSGVQENSPGSARSAPPRVTRPKLLSPSPLPRRRGGRG
jgi:hypothetical protein